MWVPSYRKVLHAFQRWTLSSKKKRNSFNLINFFQNHKMNCSSCHAYEYSNVLFHIISISIHLFIKCILLFNFYVPSKYRIETGRGLRFFPFQSPIKSKTVQFSLVRAVIEFYLLNTKNVCFRHDIPFSVHYGTLMLSIARGMNDLKRVFLMANNWRWWTVWRDSR